MGTQLPDHAAVPDDWTTTAGGGAVDHQTSSLSSLHYWKQHQYQLMQQRWEGQALQWDLASAAASGAVAAQRPPVAAAVPFPGQLAADNAVTTVTVSDASCWPAEATLRGGSSGATSDGASPRCESARSDATETSSCSSMSQENSPPPPSSSMAPKTSSSVQRLANTAVRSVTAPLRWNRVTSNGLVVYISPSGSSLTSVEEAREYLRSPGTCKCGLECPINVEEVFNFDPKVITRPWNCGGADSPSGATKTCNHRRKSESLLSSHQRAFRKDVVPTFQEQRCNPHNNPFFKEQMMQVMGQMNMQQQQARHQQMMLQYQHHQQHILQHHNQHEHQHQHQHEPQHQHWPQHAQTQQSAAAPPRVVHWQELRRHQRLASSRARRRSGGPPSPTASAAASPTVVVSPAPNVDNHQLYQLQQDHRQLSSEYCISAAEQLHTPSTTDSVMSPPSSDQQSTRQQEQRMPSAAGVGDDVGVTMPSFLEDPSGYLAQQTQMLNSTMQERLSPAPARTGPASPNSSLSSSVTAAVSCAVASVPSAAVVLPGSSGTALVTTSGDVDTLLPVRICSVDSAVGGGSDPDSAVGGGSDPDSATPRTECPSADGSPSSVSVSLQIPASPRLSTSAVATVKPPSSPAILATPIKTTAPKSAQRRQQSPLRSAPPLQGAVSSAQHPSAASRSSSVRALTPRPPRRSTPTSAAARRTAPPTLAPAPPPPSAAAAPAVTAATPQYQVIGPAAELPPFQLQQLPAGHIILPSGQVILTQPIQPMLQYVNAVSMHNQPQLLLSNGTLIQTTAEAPAATIIEQPTGGRRSGKRRKTAPTVASMLQRSQQQQQQQLAAAAQASCMPTLLLSSGQAGGAVNFMQPLLLPGASAAGAGGQLLFQTVGGQLISGAQMAAPTAGSQLLQVLSLLGGGETAAAPSMAAVVAPRMAAADSSTPGCQPSPGAVSAGGSPPACATPGAEVVTSTVGPPEENIAVVHNAAVKRKRPLLDGTADPCTRALCPGDLVWGTNQGVDSWPGQLIQRPDMPNTPSDHAWVRWFGDHTMALLPRSQLRKFHSQRGPAKPKKSSALNTSFEEAMQEALVAVGQLRK